MRLVNAVTLELEDFSNKPVPQYAILSHTWGDGEVTLQDMQDAQMASQKAGYAKIKKCCELARVRGLKYAWVDTCCIDKSSSAELSEAINSMFKWYEDSHDCYAYLADVEPEATSAVASFKKSRWFTRGWTLQELLAPTKLHFYASDWTYIATRRRISKQLSLITKIDESFLDRPDNQGIDKMLGAASIAERMSWASNRQTTREEDIAYCLLGLFGINMPLLYGEGKRAFRRLQEEIVRRSDDQSLFAWMYTAEHHGPDGFPGFLAASPSNFAESSHIVPCRAGSRRSVFSISNKGLQISLPMLEEHALLECHPSDDPSTLIVVRLRHFHGDTYGRAVDEKQGTVDQRAWRRWKRRTVNIVTNPDWFQQDEGSCSWAIRQLPEGFDVIRLPWLSLGYESNSCVSNRRIPISPVFLGCGEVDESIRFLTSDHSRNICLVLSARKLYSIIDRSRRRYWTTYQLFRQAHRFPGSLRNYWQFAWETQGTRFLGLSDGSILHATITEQDIFGERILFVDILRSPSGAKLRILQITDRIRLEAMKTLEFAIEKLLPMPPSFSWQLVVSLRQVGVVVVGVWIALFFFTRVLVELFHLEVISSPVYVVRKQVADYLTSILCEVSVFYLPVYWQLSGLYTYVKLQWTPRPRYRDNKGEVEEPLNRPLYGVLKDSVILWSTSFLALKICLWTGLIRVT